MAVHGGPLPGRSTGWIVASGGRMTLGWTAVAWTHARGYRAGTIDPRGVVRSWPDGRVLTPSEARLYDVLKPVS